MTLIELLDERPLENVLSTDMLKPERTVFVCDKSIASNRDTRTILQDYFRYRGNNAELVFIEAEHYSAESVYHALKKAVQTYPDCILDITGGTEHELFASGYLVGEFDIPVFTYSRKMNRIFSVHNAPFPESLPCTLEYSVEDFFRMTGGAMRKGRVNNSILGKYSELLEPFFAVYLKYRIKWGDTVTYLQRISQTGMSGENALSVEGAYVVKGDRGRRIEAPVDALHDLESIGMLRELSIAPGSSVSFTFADEQIRAWLRDVGSVLELYTYILCVDSGLFNDVHTSVVVDWAKDLTGNGVTNEIDVMAVKGVKPVFISCKTCEVSTDALNELAILRDRFGGKGACAVIVTTQKTRTVTGNRAQELDINVIDIDDFTGGTAAKRLYSFLNGQK